MLQLFARPTINWAAPIARLLMCAIIIDGLYHSGQPLTHWLALLWVGWAALTTAAAVIGHRQSLNELRIFAGIDSLLACISMFLLTSPEHSLWAFVLCFSVAVLGCGLGWKSFAVFAAPPFAAWLIQTGLQFTQFQPLLLTRIPEGGTSGLITVIQLWAIVAITALVYRAARTDGFAYKCNSIEMLHPDRSFEFDLQEVVENLAKVFTPDRAFCIFTRPGVNRGFRQFAHNCDPAVMAADLNALLEVTELLPERALLLDTESQQCWPLDATKPRVFNDTELALARFLKRDRLAVVIVQRVQIGREHGVMVVAAMKPIDACLRVDAIKIEKAVTQLMSFLARMAEAERQFIGDAHDVARRDLHDGVLQTMAALRMKLLTIAKREDLATHPAHLDIRKAADILTLEQARLRGLLETSESENDTINLVARLDICMRAISLQWEIDAKIESEEPGVPIDRESALNIEHLAREAVANAVRHAKITALTVRLSLKHDALLIAIIDQEREGKHAGKGGESMPLQSASLQHRLRLVNGTAYSEGLSKGTLLAISIPMQRIEDA